jgi:hypothetical protein
VIVSIQDGTATLKTPEIPGGDPVTVKVERLEPIRKT